jgi:hypothetical protein
MKVSRSPVGAWTALGPPPGNKSSRGGKICGKVNILNEKKLFFCPQKVLNY